MQQCEDLEDAESLRALHGIVRGAIMLNDASLLELLLAEDNVMDTVRGAHALHVLMHAAAGPPLRRPPCMRCMPVVPIYQGPYC